MTADGRPSLEEIILDLAHSISSDIPDEMLERIVSHFTATQFDDDRAASLQFMRDIAEEYVVETIDAKNGGAG